MSKWMEYLVGEDLLAEASPNDLESRIEKAKDWRDLEAVLTDAEMAFSHDEITAEAVERIAFGVRRKARVVPEIANGLQLSAMFRENSIRRIRSGVLGEDILIATDDDSVPPELPGIIYRASELAAIIKMGPEALKRIHAVKKVFDGVLIGGNTAND